MGRSGSSRRLAGGGSTGWQGDHRQVPLQSAECHRPQFVDRALRWTLDELVPVVHVAPPARIRLLAVGTDPCQTSSATRPRPGLAQGLSRQVTSGELIAFIDGEPFIAATTPSSTSTSTSGGASVFANPTSPSSSSACRPWPWAAPSLRSAEGVDHLNGSVDREGSIGHQCERSVSLAFCDY